MCPRGVPPPLIPPVAPWGGPAAVDPAGGADAEQGLVGENVLPVEESDLTAGQNLAPGAADRQVHLAHVDLGAEAVVSAGASGIGPALNLGRKAEVHAEIGVPLFTLRIEHRKRGKQSGSQVEALATDTDQPTRCADRTPVGALALVDGKCVHVA